MLDPSVYVPAFTDEYRAEAARREEARRLERERRQRELEARRPPPEMLEHWEALEYEDDEAAQAAVSYARDRGRALDYEEIGELMGLCPESIRSIEAKARAKLAKRLDRKAWLEELRWVEHMRELRERAEFLGVEDLW